MLLLDDNPADRVLLREALREAEPTARIHEASNPQEALEWMRRTTGKTWSGTLLLDWRLGRETGAEILRAVRADPMLSRAHVLVLTGCDDAVERGRAMEAGADGWIIKPQDFGAYAQLAREIVVRGVSARQAGSAMAPTAEELGLASMSTAAALSLPLDPTRILSTIEEMSRVFPRGVEVLKDIVSLVAGSRVATPQSPSEDERERLWLEIARECRDLKLFVADAINLGVVDQTTVAKRKSLLQRLLRNGWSDGDLREFFRMDERTFRRRRSEVRRTAKVVDRALSAALA